MRNRVWFRILSFLTALLFLCVSFLFFLKAASGLGFLNDTYSSIIKSIIVILTQNPWLYYVLAGITLILGLVFIYASFARENKKSVMISKNEYGEFIISTTAINDMVQNTVSKYEDIKTNNVKVSHKNNEIIVRTAIEVSTASHLPSVVRMLQKSIKEHIEDCTGLIVKDVNVNIKNNNDEGLKVYKNMELLPEPSTLSTENIEETKQPSLVSEPQVHTNEVSETDQN